MRELLNPLFTNFLGLSNDEIELLHSGNIEDGLSQKIKKAIGQLTTKSAAKTDKEVHSHVKALTLGGIEDAVLGYVKSNFNDLIDDDLLKDIKGSPDAKKKTATIVIDLLKHLDSSYKGQISALQEKSKNSGAKASEEHLKRITDLEEALKGSNSTISEWEQKYADREIAFNNQRVDGEISRLLSGASWKDTAPEMIDLFTSTVIKKAKEGAGFGFDDKGKLSIHNKEDSSLGVFGEDKTRPLNTQEYILSIAKPFMSKNDANRDRSNGRNAHNPSTKQPDLSSMTSIQRRAFEKLNRDAKAIQG